MAVRASRTWSWWEPGPAGLAVARELGHRHAISALVVDKADAPAMSWRNRYDNFRLNTNGFISTFPGNESHCAAAVGRPRTT